jgi:hypothetical protein
MSHQNKINLGENLGRATWGKFRATNICVIQLIALNLVITKMTFDCESPIMIIKKKSGSNLVVGSMVQIEPLSIKQPKKFQVTTKFFLKNNQFLFKW